MEGTSHTLLRGSLLSLGLVKNLYESGAVLGRFIMARGCQSESESTNWPLAMTNLPRTGTGSKLITSHKVLDFSKPRL